MGKSKKVTYRYSTEEDQAKESALEEFLFGTGSAVSRLLAKPDDNEEEQLSIADLVRQAEVSTDEDQDGEDFFVEDRAGAADATEEQPGFSDDDQAGPGPSSERLQQQQQAAGKGRKRSRAPVWEDPADADISVAVAAAPRLRKLRQTKGQTELTGAEYEAALRRQHCLLHSRTSWAVSSRQQHRDRAVAGKVTEIDEQQEPDEETVERLLRSGSNLLLGGAAGAAGQGGLLPPGSVELSRLRDANGASPSDAVVQSVQFHPGGQLMLTAGFDKRLKLFQVDGLRNPLVQSLFLQDCPIQHAEFAAGGNLIVAAGRRPFYYIADLGSSRLERVVTPPSLHHQGQRSAGQQGSKNAKGKGSSRSSGGLKSCESFAVSPDPLRPLMAFLGDAGHIGLVSLSSRAPVGSLKMNGSARAAVFSSDGNTLITAGSDGVLYTWDLRSQRCLQQQRDEGAIDCTALALSPDGTYLATGGSSGVVSVYKRPAGLLSAHTGNLDSSSSMQSSEFGQTPLGPKPLKVLMNLTTTVDTLSFNHDSQMLLMGSRMKKEALRLVHLPSLTVFSNWPTSRSPLHYVHSAAFSPHSGFLGVGNAKGRVLLYRLHHYPEA